MLSKSVDYVQLRRDRLVRGPKHRNGAKKFQRRTAAHPSGSVHMFATAQTDSAQRVILIPLIPLLDSFCLNTQSESDYND
jgi:hypothetical protein